ncbi:spindle and kinetochore-associated protein 1-like [Ctenocephalides felis]|uniref:spindle and kinetochore-associated protein 1-like n=1 Tax=Ctenocephalides felis TaxID=7515 RepID=UPI000E6E3B38|nr:spindle and kinetochore-associated protein 1-like [Ctenocephalides felis]
MDEIKQLADGDGSMQGQLQEMLNLIEKTRARLNRLRKSLSAVPANQMSCGDNSTSTHLGSNVQHSEESPMMQSNPVPDPVLTGVTKRITVNGVPQVSYMELEEFESIPYYLRGRLRVETLNDFIELINMPLTVNTKLLKLPRHEVPRYKLHEYRRYKRLEAVNESGIKFIMTSDFV